MEKFLQAFSLETHNRGLTEAEYVILIQSVTLQSTMNVNTATNILTFCQIEESIV